MDGAGHVIYGPVPITSGRPGYRTPIGVFHVLYKDIDHLSQEFDNAPMPYSVFFVGGIAFHAGSLSVQSHGCIHLSTAAAQKYFNTLHVGDIVQVVP
jgi:lipoprotein-anchoring transpeptidase ErfK/SrfK